MAAIRFKEKIRAKSMVSISLNAKFFQMKKIVVENGMEETQFEDILVDGNSLFGFPGAIPSATFHPLAFGVALDRERSWAQSCIQLNVTNTTDRDVDFDGEIQGFYKVPAS